MKAVVRSLVSTPPAGVLVLDRAERVSDAELVRRGRAGESWALESIYRRYVVLIASVARRMLRSSSDVDDVVQDTFLAAFDKLDRLVEPAALRGWLAQIAVSRVHRRYRWRKLANLLSSDDPQALIEQQAAASASPDQVAELALIDRALAKMSLKLRTPWMLRHVIGAGLDEISIACSCSLATVKRRIADADAIVARFVAGEREAT